VDISGTEVANACCRSRQLRLVVMTITLCGPQLCPNTAKAMMMSVSSLQRRPGPEARLTTRWPFQLHASQQMPDPGHESFGEWCSIIMHCQTLLKENNDFAAEVMTVISDTLRYPRADDRSSYDLGYSTAPPFLPIRYVDPLAGYLLNNWNDDRYSFII
jgi:hypothetical protein